MYENEENTQDTEEPEEPKDSYPDYVTGLLIEYTLLGKKVEKLWDVLLGRHRYIPDAEERRLRIEQHKHMVRYHKTLAKRIQRKL